VLFNHCHFQHCHIENSADETLTELPMPTIKENTATPKTGTNTTALEKRLPCRGCTNACVNYQHCDGKPWRTLAK
jgi:hypothetical protein